MIEVIEAQEAELINEQDLIITLSGKISDRIDNISIYFKEDKKDE